MTNILECLLLLRFLFQFALVAFPCALFAQVPSNADIIIHGGKLLDGTGNPWIKADVAIDGDRIIAVGNLSDMHAEKSIDATGLYVAPGFIDTHSHAASGLARETTSDAKALLAQGITTVLINPDGRSAIDLNEQREELLEHGIGVNAALMIGHGSVRREVLGMDDRAPTEVEMQRMKELVREGMEAGAFGLSSGPFYAPGSYSETSELIALAKIAAEYGGAHQSHIRDESDYNIGLIASVDEVIEIARESNLPGIVTHIKALGPGVWGYSEAVVRRIERARDDGIEIWADQYPYNASSTGLSSALVPRWAQAGGDEEFLARLQDKKTRAQIREEMIENLARRGGPDRILLKGIGKTLEEVSNERGEHPIDTAMAMFEDGSAGGIISFNMDDRDVERFMRQPWTMTASDGSLPEMGDGQPHPRGYGTFPRKLGLYTRDRGIVNLPQAIRSMTYLPASVYRIKNRGIIKEGAFADIVVFDYQRINDPATFDDPHQMGEGMVHVLVNGNLAIDSEQFTGAKNGRVLRR